MPKDKIKFNTAATDQSDEPSSPDFGVDSIKKQATPDRGLSTQDGVEKLKGSVPDTIGEKHTAAEVDDATEPAEPSAAPEPPPAKPKPKQKRKPKTTKQAADPTPQPERLELSRVTFRYREFIAKHVVVEHLPDDLTPGKTISWLQGIVDARRHPLDKSPRKEVSEIVKVEPYHRVNP